MRRLLLLAALALSACATGPRMSPAQAVYIAYGSYGAAVRSFADYANGPTADAGIVHQGRTVVDSPETKGAVAFGRAYVACRGSNATTATTPGVVCANWDFSHPSAFAITLRNTAATVLAILAKGKNR